MAGEDASTHCYGEGTHTLLWRGHTHTDMERAHTHCYGEGTHTLIWRGHTHTDMERAHTHTETTAPPVSLGLLMSTRCATVCALIYLQRR